MQVPAEQLLALVFSIACDCGRQAHFQSSESYVGATPKCAKPVGSPPFSRLRLPRKSCRRRSSTAYADAACLHCIRPWPQHAFLPFLRLSPSHACLPCPQAYPQDAFLPCLRPRTPCTCLPYPHPCPPVLSKAIRVYPQDGAAAATRAKSDSSSCRSPVEGEGMWGVSE